MRAKSYLHSAFVALLIAAAAGPGHGQAEATALDTAALHDAAISVRSIDIADDEFSDLASLKKSIGDARIVVLGEGTHSEGTTSRAKARLVRYLHEKMGFEVLVWESGLFGAYAANATLSDTQTPIASVRPYISTWGNEAAVQPLLEYARLSLRSKRPLLMAGIDRERAVPVPAYFEQFFRAFFDRAPQLAFNDDEWVIAKRFTSRALALQRPKGQLPPEADRAVERAFMEKFAGRLQANRANLKGKFSESELRLAERFVSQALRGEEFNYTAASDFQKANAIRDRIMADNLVWLLEDLYPGKKVIVWAATAHFLRNSTRIRNVKEGWTHPDWYAGNLLQQRLSGQIYTIGFTSYAGEFGLIFEDEKMKPRVETEKESPAGSFEAAAHDLGKPYLFVDLKKTKQGALRKPFVTLALGRDANVAVWRNSLDALFFIDAAEPRRILR